MKINVIGAGVVGKATGEGFKRVGHEVTYSDKGDQPQNIHGMDYRFVCVPEAVVPSVIEQLGMTQDPNDNVPIVIRSTVPPGTTEKLQRKYQELALLHNPEFLRAGVAEFEFMDADFVVLGAPVAYTNVDEVEYYGVDALYEEMGKAVTLCDSSTSELLKLTMNAYLSTQISFWNAVRSVAERHKVESHLLARVMLQDKRVSRYGAVAHGTAYGGACLPKDLAQMTHLVEALEKDGQDVDSHLAATELFLKAVRGVNMAWGGK